MRAIPGIMTWIICSGLVPGVCSATGADSVAGIQCIGSLASWRAGDHLQQASWECIRAWARSRGIPIVNKAEWAVWVDAAYVSNSDTNQLMLSVGIAHTLPDDAIEAGKQAEVFYSFLSPERRAKLPEEGKWVRQKMTEEFLVQFVMPIDHRIVLVHRSEVWARLGSLLDELTMDRVRQEKN